MIFLDTEFDGCDGPLISLAMVSSASDKEFYGVVKDVSAKEPWVLENVIPKLMIGGKIPLFDKDKLMAEVQAFLLFHIGMPVIADWPEDFKHLLDQLYYPGGRRFNIDLQLKLINSGDCKSKIPHNALADARALMEWYGGSHYSSI